MVHDFGVLRRNGIPGSTLPWNRSWKERPCFDEGLTSAAPVSSLFPAGEGRHSPFSLLGGCQPGPGEVGLMV